MAMRPEDASRSDRELSHSCAENVAMLSRRSFLGASAALFTSALLPSLVEASVPGHHNRMLIVLLRGGIDGLSSVIPFGDPQYEEHRGDLVIARDRINPITSIFGLHPALENFYRFYQQGEAAIIPSVGLPVQTRSHFECQANLENGLPNNSASATGWLNRFLGGPSSHRHFPHGRAMTLGPTPQILAGPAPVLSWSPSWFGPPMPQVLSRLDRMYAAGYRDLAQSLSQGIASNEFINGRVGDLRSNLSPLELGFRGAGRLLNSSDGPQIAVLSVSGWDTHNAQGTLEGQIANRLAGLDAGFGSFRDEMSASTWANTVVLCVSEFGRSVKINGTSGTDHGVGMPVFVLGGSVRGGILGDWPGMKSNNLIGGRDLRPTMDLRSVFKGVLHSVFGATIGSLDNVIFPNSAAAAPSMGNIVRPANGPVGHGGRGEEELSRQAVELPDGRHYEQFNRSGQTVRVAEPLTSPSSASVGTRDFRSYRAIYGRL